MAPIVTIVHFNDNIGRSSHALCVIVAYSESKCDDRSLNSVQEPLFRVTLRVCEISRCYVKVFLRLFPVQMTSYGPVLRLCEPELWHHKGHLPAGRSFRFAHWRIGPAGQKILIWRWQLCVTCTESI